MTARIAVSFHPELDGKAQLEESTLYVHFRHGRIEAAEIAGAVFTPAQLRAIAEASGWSWELFLEELRFKAEDHMAPVDFVPVEARS